jgi:hypothetical protein
MRMIKSVVLIGLGVVLGTAATIVNAREGAQGTAYWPAQMTQPGQPVGPIITGENIGFQLVASDKGGDIATGKLMIKVNGRWLPAAAPMGLVRTR